MHIALQHLILIVLVGTLTVSTAAQADEASSLDAVRQESRELLDALQKYGADQREQALRETESALARLDARIQDLEARIDARWDTMSAAAREDARRGLQELRRQRIELAEWYGGLKSSSAKAWDHVKQGFAEAYSTLQDSWREAVKAYEE